jgi:tRNA nucleotidyltransferase (CCA-adding enzyme)
MGQREEDLIVGLAVLLHDIGKATTTKVEPKDGRLHAYRHEEESFRLAPEFLSQITRETKLVEAILPLVRWHAQPYELYRIKASDAAVRRLATKVGRIDRLIRVDAADRQGRAGYYESGPSPQGVWLKEISEKLKITDTAPKRLVLGRHLIALGYKPAGWFSTILDEAFEAQLDGIFVDEASGLSWLRERMTTFKV